MRPKLAKNLSSNEIHSLGCHVETCADVAQAARDSLIHPLGFKALDQVTVPGDQIVSGGSRFDPLYGAGDRGGCRGFGRVGNRSE